MRLQGVPARVNVWTTTEDWNFGNNRVTFDHSTERDIEWKNLDWNLKVE